MINEKDIYTHLKHGGDPEALHQAFLNELNEAQKKVDEEKIAEQEAAKKEAYIKEVRKDAVDALARYFALFNPNVTENIISSVLSTLESVRFKDTKNGTVVWGNSDLTGWLDILDIFMR